MMKAGIDFGSSLVKAAWFRDGRIRFSSTADIGLEGIMGQLHEDVTKISLVGIGHSNAQEGYFKDFEVHVPKGDPIKTEKRLQVEGAKKLLESEGNDISNFILVSVGTGTSYTLRSLGVTLPVPLGNSLSGGFLSGVGKLLGVESYLEMSQMALEGRPLNIYVKDKLPHLDGTVFGEYVVAHLAQAGKNSSTQDVLATAVDIVGATTVKDIALLSSSSRLFKWTKNVVYIGSTVSTFPALRNSLERYSTMLGKVPYFPQNGEFALALAAYHMKE